MSVCGDFEDLLSDIPLNNEGNRPNSSEQANLAANNDAVGANSSANYCAASGGHSNEEWNRIRKINEAVELMNAKKLESQNGSKADRSEKVYTGKVKF